MMDLNILERFETKALMDIRDRIALILDKRLDTRVAVGRYVDFTDKNGDTRTARITKINAKSLNAEEAATSISPGLRWRLSRELVRVHPEIVVPKADPKTVAPTAPITTYSGDAW